MEDGLSSWISATQVETWMESQAFGLAIPSCFRHLGNELLKLTWGDILNEIRSLSVPPQLPNSLLNYVSPLRDLLYHMQLCIKTDSLANSINLNRNTISFNNPLLRYINERHRTSIMKSCLYSHVYYTLLRMLDVKTVDISTYTWIDLKCAT